MHKLSTLMENNKTHKITVTLTRDNVNLDARFLATKYLISVM